MGCKLLVRDIQCWKNRLLWRR